MTDESNVPENFEEAERIFLESISDSQRQILEEAENLMQEMLGNVTDFESLPKSEQAERINALNGRFCEMLGMNEEEMFSSVDDFIDEDRKNRIARYENTEVPEDLLDDLKRLVKNVIYIKAEIGGNVCSYTSKIGGNPDLPADFKWYRNNNGTPFTFVMQINCSEIHAFDKDNILSEKGMLYFFYDFENNAWNSEDGGYAVYYYDGSLSELKPTVFPSAENPCVYYAYENRMLTETPVSFFAESDLPDYEDYLNMNGKEYDITEYESAKYRILGYDSFAYSEEYFKIGGYSNIIQNSVVEEMGDDYIQLCQLSTYECNGDGCGFEFGDSGNLYLYINKNDLAEKHFDNIKLLLQCY